MKFFGTYDVESKIKETNQKSKLHKIRVAPINFTEDRQGISISYYADKLDNKPNLYELNSNFDFYRALGLLLEEVARAYPEGFKVKKEKDVDYYELIFS